MTERPKKQKIEDALDLGAMKGFAEGIAREAGALVLTAFTEKARITFKGAVDMVTETDKEVERVIFASIRATFPDHATIGEESVAAGEHTERLGDAPTWIVDPIDGTTNFVHGLPWCGISIGFAVGGTMMMGVVFNPMLDEMFAATLGGGATLNGVPIKVSSCASMAHALIATGFSYDRRPDSLDFHLGKVRKVLGKCRDIRRIGSAALDMCAVACGRLDAYYEQGIHVWDIAAGAIILTEAGGVVCDPYTGNIGALDYGGRGVLAVTHGIAQELADVLKDDNPPTCE